MDFFDGTFDWPDSERLRIILESVVVSCRDRLMPRPPFPRHHFTDIWMAWSMHNWRKKKHNPWGLFCMRICLVSFPWGSFCMRIYRGILSLGINLHAYLPWYPFPWGLFTSGMQLVSQKGSGGSQWVQIGTKKWLKSDVWITTKVCKNTSGIVPS